MKRPRLAKRIRPSEWPRLAVAGREATVFIQDLTLAERDTLRRLVHYSGASDSYVATCARELDRVIAVACGPHFAHRRSLEIRLEWPERKGARG